MWLGQVQHLLICFYLLLSQFGAERVVAEETILNDPVLESFIGPLYFYCHMSEFIGVRPDTLIYPLHDVAQDSYNNWLPFLGGDVILKLRP